MCISTGLESCLPAPICRAWLSFARKLEDLCSLRASPMRAGPLPAGVLTLLSVLAPALLPVPSPRMRLAAGSSCDVPIITMGAVGSTEGMLWLDVATDGALKVSALERIASAAGLGATLA